MTADRAVAGVELTPRRLAADVGRRRCSRGAIAAARRDGRSAPAAAGAADLALWFLSPRSPTSPGSPLRTSRVSRSTTRSARRCGRIARKTWRFFEELFTPADHWLIPDNYQENRADLIAHRTSPTNIGLQLLSTLAAYDFGYLSVAGVLDRLEPTFGTLLAHAALSRPLLQLVRHPHPRAAACRPYISTVDSGNLAGYLLTLRCGLLRAGRRSPSSTRRLLDGLEDALDLFEAEAVRRRRAQRVRAMRGELDESARLLDRRPATLIEWRVDSSPRSANG